jgi:hypothetical protein
MGKGWFSRPKPSVTESLAALANQTGLFPVASRAGSPGQSLVVFIFLVLHIQGGFQYGTSNIG